VPANVKPLSEPSILDQIKHSLVSADRSIELARRERERVLALSSGNGAEQEAEQRILVQARERRERLAALEPPVAASPDPVPAPPQPLASVSPPDQRPAADLPVLDLIGQPVIA